MATKQLSPVTREPLVATGANVSMEFPVSADSPFSDGYDIASERDALADLVAAATKDDTDPRWRRFLVLCEREAELLRSKANPSEVRGAVPVDSSFSAKHQRVVGPLADQEPDTLALHTKEAYWAFSGRQADPDGSVVHIVGGWRFAAVLKSIWHLSGNDNPYADWLLIRMHDRLTALRWKIECRIERDRVDIEAAKVHGFSFSVLSSRAPKLVTLEFRSPYGYATASVIAVFDYYVRSVKTLIRKDRITDVAGRQAIREMVRELRALFLEPIRWERFLLREQMKALCRADFMRDAHDDGKKRVIAATAYLGEVPAAILSGALMPRHSRRPVQAFAARAPLVSATSGHIEPARGLDASELV